MLSWGNAGSPQVWDPETGNFTEAASPNELFCSGHSFLPDGRVLVAGGHIASDRGIADMTIFSPEDNSWTQVTPMRRGRWYPTNTTLANGSVVILAGRDEVGDEVAEPEVWSPSGIRQLNNASLVLPYYPRTFVAPNGLVFYAGEQPTTRYLNTSGNGSWTTVGERRYGARPYGAAVMYEEGKILYAGGGRTTNTAEIIDLNSAAPTWQWTGSMAFARRNHNATVLPTGEVLVTGGSSAAAFNDVSQAIHAAEMWSPVTGLWTTMASNAVSRTYHSTTLLLPDGRVLHAGSGEGADMPEERNAEVFSPPYLERGPRPTIADAPGLVGYGTTFDVQTPEAADIAKISLIRIGSVTHAFDMNQRLLWLPFVAQSGSLTVTAPVGGTRAPPGHYMLFLVNQNGVPSVAKIVKVGNQSEPGPGPNVPPEASFLAGCGGQNCAFADRSTDPDGNLSSWHWSFGDGESSTSRDPSHAYAAPGTYTVTLTARDREDATHSASRQVTVPGPQFPITLTLTTKTEPNKQTAMLKWTGVQGSQVYVYRNGLVLNSSPNDSKQNVSKSGSGPATFIFKVCEAATSICSNPATANFSGGEPIDNATPNAIFTPTCGASGCRFSDGSTDADGTVTGWAWDFGDGGSSTERNPTHLYAVAGEYTVRLTVTDNRGGQGSGTRRITAEEPVNQAPTASFTVSCTVLDCGFTDGSGDLDGTVTGWAWDFGDGGSSGEQNPAHSYGAAGTYAVSLRVTDDDSEQSGVTTREVTVSIPGPNQDPVADFSSSCTGLACAFTDLSTDSDGTVTGWSWSFGDGATSTSRNPTRTYAAGGTYTVNLAVTDDDGGTHQRSASVTVTAPPSGGITLSITGHTDAAKHYIAHTWSGATGSSVDLWRNGRLITATPNDGKHTTAQQADGTKTYRVKVCQAGSSTVCSPERTITLSN